MPDIIDRLRLFGEEAVFSMQHRSFVFSKKECTVDCEKDIILEVQGQDTKLGSNAHVTTAQKDETVVHVFSNFVLFSILSSYI